MKVIIPIIICVLIILGCSQKENKGESLQLSSGKVERIKNFKSAFVPPRNVDVWLPDNYSAKNQYAVLYMHDGQ